MDIDKLFQDFLDAYGRGEARTEDAGTLHLSMLMLQLNMQRAAEARHERFIEREQAALERIATALEAIAAK